jgi:PAS domain S-box-containing protein
MAMVSGQNFPFGDSEIFQLLIDSIEDYAIYMLDPTGHVVTWNRGAEFNKGYSRQEAIGRHLRTFLLLKM